MLRENTGTSRGGYCIGWSGLSSPEGDIYRRGRIGHGRVWEEEPGRQKS